MKILVDTDGFCKLAIAGLLEDALHVLGADLADSARLPALPHMLRRGRLRMALGPDTCDALLPLAERIGAMGPASPTWLEPLTSLEGIDPGEAQILAVAAERGLVVLSGDKRALRTVKAVPRYADALAGNIVTVEAVLIALCDTIGPDELRRCVVPALSPRDTAIRICFSEPASDPRVGLRSYHDRLATDVAPLILWTPPPARPPT